MATSTEASYVVFTTAWSADGPRSTRRASAARERVQGHAPRFSALVLQVQAVLRNDPLSGHLFVFRGPPTREVIWHDGPEACLFTKSLERGKFIWLSVADAVTIARQSGWEVRE